MNNIEIPDVVAYSAKIIDDWCKINNHKEYQIMGICSRSYAYKLEKAQELIKVFQEYLEFLNKANETPIMLAAIHGWECDKQIVTEGILYRDKINTLIRLL